MIKKNICEDEIFKEIINKYNEINKEDNKRKVTPLVYAIKKKRENFVKLLLDSNKIDIDQKDNNKKTPVDHALKTKNSKILKPILLYKKNDKKTPVDHALKTKESKILKPILLYKKNVEKRNDDKYKLLMSSIINNEFKGLGRLTDINQKYTSEGNFINFKLNGKYTKSF